MVSLPPTFSHGKWLQGKQKTKYYNVSDEEREKRLSYKYIGMDECDPHPHILWTPSSSSSSSFLFGGFSSEKRDKNARNTDKCDE